MKSRKSIRLKGFNYNTPGLYFITICTKNREPYFGQNSRGYMKLNQLGESVLVCWKNLEAKFPELTACEIIVMTDHIHGILRIKPHPHLPYSQDFESKVMCGIPRYVQFFKNKTNYLFQKGQGLRRNTKVILWQRNYYERVIRNFREFENVKKYIRDNPRKHFDHPSKW